MSVGNMQLHAWIVPFSRRRPKKGERWHAEDYFGVQEFEFLLKASDGFCIGSGTLEEWRLVYPRGDENAGAGDDLKMFVWAADVHSGQTYAASEVILDAWKHVWYVNHPFHRGNVILFQRLQIEARSSAESNAAWQLINRFLKDHFPPRPKSRCDQASMIVLKAFPLKFEGADDKANSPEFRRQRAAMMRLYHHRLGAEPLPGKNGLKGWMFVPIARRELIEPRPRRMPKAKILRFPGRERLRSSA